MPHVPHAPNSALLDTIVANICVVDREGTIVAVNQAWKDFADENDAPDADDKPFGVGVNYFDVCRRATGSDESVAGKAADGLRDVLEGKRERCTLEYPCHSPTEQRWFLLTISPLLVESGGAIISHFNITRQTELQRANVELDAFARSLAINLRTPLSAITSGLKRLSEQAGAKAPELGEEISNVQHSVASLDRLVSDLLAYSRITPPGERVRPVELRDVLEHAVDSLQIDEEPARVALEHPEDLPRVVGNHDSIVQAATAVLTTALRTATDEHPLTVRVAPYHNSECVGVQFEDDSSGIPDDIGDPFELFPQGRQIPGLCGDGLGLSIARKALRPFGGEVEVESRDGEGTTVTFKFSRTSSTRGR